jgi:hypothetical protein
MKAKLMTFLFFIAVVLQANSNASTGKVTFIEAKREGLTCRDYIRTKLLRFMLPSSDKEHLYEFPRDYEKRKFVLDHFEDTKITQQKAVKYTTSLYQKRVLKPRFLKEGETCPIFDEYAFLESLIYSLDAHDWGRQLAKEAKQKVLNYLKKQVNKGPLPLMSVHVYFTLTKEYAEKFTPRLALAVNRELFELEIAKDNLKRNPDFLQDLAYSNEFRLKLRNLLNRPEFIDSISK